MSKAPPRVTPTEQGGGRRKQRNPVALPTVEAAIADAQKCYVQIIETDIYIEVSKTALREAIAEWAPSGGRMWLSAGGLTVNFEEFDEDWKSTNGWLLNGEQLMNVSTALAWAVEAMLTDCPDEPETVWLPGHITPVQAIAILDQPRYLDWFDIDALVAAAIQSKHVHKKMAEEQPDPDDEDQPLEWWEPCEADDPEGAPWTCLALADAAYDRE